MAQPMVSSSPAMRGESVSLGDRLFETRQLTLDLVQGLSAEDMTVQAMDDASPTKWHLAHTNWFFENFVLAIHREGYAFFDETFNYCFNSYYETLGARQPRGKRGLLTRPSCELVFAYREHVDRQLEELVGREIEPGSELARVIEVGINHEQQHQELLLTDILALFAANPLRPAYRASRPRVDQGEPEALRWIEYTGGLHEMGHAGNGFAWDNETPRHRELIHPFKIADRLITNAEWLNFIEDGGYRNFSLWLADGWTMVNREGWNAPLYWEEREGQWLAMSLEGLRPLDRAAPVAHVSYYEADAFARWAGRRLPTEFEWELAAKDVPASGNTLASKALRPLPAGSGSDGRPRQLFGDVWEWTGNAYLPYPGYRAALGALGEYNGKFMVSQQVLRGGSCATPEGHARATYRNFFYPHQRWQFMGLRLASEIA
ncbi:ergothioneine biosynthesis protein EgtB [Beijerinckiaceae bacterium]|nr:ergothioneine biosynthesis protein EgtB [Beijerinckiaceae bacterium]